MIPALKRAVIGTVTIQAYAIFLKRLQSTAPCLASFVFLFSISLLLFPLSIAFKGALQLLSLFWSDGPPLIHPTNTTEPTLQWVVEIGRPTLLASSTVIAAPISIVKPLLEECYCKCEAFNFVDKTYVEAVILVKSLPIVSMTRRPHNHKPIEMPTPPNTRMYIGVSAVCNTVPSL